MTYSYLDGLNPAQRFAVDHGVGNEFCGPLLVIAGAGSGKTNTLAHRVAHLILNGANPERILLLTFTRRAAAEMIRRCERIVARAISETTAEQGSAATIKPIAAGKVSWAGTFHGIANRLLRLHAEGVGLDPAFTILDRSDAADLMNLIRGEMGYSKAPARFPKKDTCLAIYSHTVNARGSIEETLDKSFPWCRSWNEELQQLFAGYVEAKQKRHVLDYDDLLLYWWHLMTDKALAELVRQRFDHVLVDEYQDTNALQAEILLALKPDGAGLSVVGDDAQSIYSFRAATVRNILDFPSLFDPPARVVSLEQNYRSSQPILDACNGVIGLSQELFPKRLFSRKPSQQKPVLATVEDEADQVDYVIERILGHREEGIDLRRQAVLMRSGHHSGRLEVALAQRNIPFVKYGGLKFLEVAHVKDVLCILRWAENPRDEVAAFRALQILPGIGPSTARRVMDRLQADNFDFATIRTFSAPRAAARDWSPFCGVLLRLSDRAAVWPGQLGLVRNWYEPHLERMYDAAHVRAADLEQLEEISAAYPSRERFLSEVTLDPPNATGDEAGTPLLDEDYLILSTIHSAKGQEWDVVYILNVVDGCIPSDMATGTPEEIEEERRVLYVAMTRAKDQLVPGASPPLLQAPTAPPRQRTHLRAAHTLHSGLDSRSI